MFRSAAINQLVKWYGIYEIKACQIINHYIHSGKYADLCDFLNAKRDTSGKEAIK